MRVVYNLAVELRAPAVAPRTQCCTWEVQLVAVGRSGLWVPLWSVSGCYLGSAAATLRLLHTMPSLGLGLAMAAWLVLS